MSALARFVHILRTQIALKLCSFGATALLTRSLAPDAKGLGFSIDVAAVAVGFFAREAIRSVHARTPIRTVGDVLAARGSGGVAAFIAILTGAMLVVISSLISAAHAAHASVNTAVESTPTEALKKDPSFTIPVFGPALPSVPVPTLIAISCIFCLGVVLDQLAESYWSLLAPIAGVAPRLRAEAAALISRLLTTLMCLVLLQHSVVSLFFDSIATSGGGVEAAAEIREQFEAVALQICGPDPAQRSLVTAAFAFSIGHLLYGLSVFVLGARSLAAALISSGAPAEPSDTDAEEGVVADAATADADNPEVLAARTVAKVFRVGVAGQGRIVHPVRSVYVFPSAASMMGAMRLYLGAQRALFSQLVQESVVRLALAEGEKVVLSITSTLGARGLFDVVSGVGSLVARLIFRLWEDFAFSEWSRRAGAAATGIVRTPAPTERLFAMMASDINSGDDSSSATTIGDTPQTKARVAVAAVAHAEALDDNLQLLSGICRLANTIGSFFVAFGAPLAWRALFILCGRQWADTPGAARVLAAYFCVLPLFGLNGLLEAFIRAVATPAIIAQSRWGLTALSVVYLAATAAAATSAAAAAAPTTVTSSGGALPKDAFPPFPNATAVSSPTELIAFFNAAVSSSVPFASHIARAFAALFPPGGVANVALALVLCNGAHYVLRVAWNLIIVRRIVRVSGKTKDLAAAALTSASVPSHNNLRNLGSANDELAAVRKWVAVCAPPIALSKVALDSAPRARVLAVEVATLAAWAWQAYFGGASAASMLVGAGGARVGDELGGATNPTARLSMFVWGRDELIIVGGGVIAVATAMAAEPVFVAAVRSRLNRRRGGDE